MSMRKYLLTFILFLTYPVVYAAPTNPYVLLQTDLGKIVIELFPREAPTTVKNFLEYVDSDFYTNTVFHRVVPGFVIQGGGLTAELVAKTTNSVMKREQLKHDQTKPDIFKNEANNGLKNDYQMVAMATTATRTNETDTMTPQFFINLQSNPALNSTGKKAGYTVFGKVIEGMDVAEKISLNPRGMHEQFPESPNSAIRILKAERIDPNKISMTSKNSDELKSDNSTIADEHNQLTDGSENSK